ncbi:MAG TPA: hypothetical protein VFT01_07815 [Homoserinimonas sp.]|nr:hypothetical protein [Homoserinimonas sp.]
MSNLVEKLADKIPSSLGAKLNYGEPVTLGGVEAVPVSLVWFGFGGGSDETGQAGGGGGGGVSIPVGVYTGGPDGPRFRPNPVTLMALLVPVLGIGAPALAKLVRALKR